MANKITAALTTLIVFFSTEYLVYYVLNSAMYIDVFLVRGNALFNIQMGTPLNKNQDKIKIRKEIKNSYQFDEKKKTMYKNLCEVKKVVLPVKFITLSVYTKKIGEISCQ